MQNAREWLQEHIKALDTGNKWTTTLSSADEYSATRTCKIGHAAPSPDSMKRRRVTLPVDWIVKESNEQESVRDMYAAVAFDENSIVARLLELAAVRSVVVTEVGPIQFGPSGFITAESEITVVMDDTTTPAEEPS